MSRAQRSYTNYIVLHHSEEEERWWLCGERSEKRATALLLCAPGWVLHRLVRLTPTFGGENGLHTENLTWPHPFTSFLT